MIYKFFANPFIEKPFFHEIAMQLGGTKKKGAFNGKDAYAECRCLSCSRKKAVIGYMRSGNTYMLA